MGKGRAPCCDKSKVKRGPWTPSEDIKLITFINNFGHSNWRALPSQAGLLRCGKSCRLRWINYLRPDVKRGNFTPKEEETIVKLHQTYGNKWSKIASFLPGRTDNEIKNVWNTHLKKRLGIKSNKRNTTKRTKCKKPSNASVLESSFSKSSSFLRNDDQVDRNSKGITSLNSITLDCDTSTAPNDGKQNESPSPSLISCVSNVSINDQSLVHMDTNFGTSVGWMHIEDFGALDELGLQIPLIFDEPTYWSIVEFDNLCSLQNTRIEGHPCNALEESSLIGSEDRQSFTCDAMTQNWVRNLEIELGLDDMNQ
ncbi:hypothetical protein V2J09_013568 [Rumex salicifolius]